VQTTKKGKECVTKASPANDVSVVESGVNAATFRYYEGPLRMLLGFSLALIERHHLISDKINPSIIPFHFYIHFQNGALDHYERHTYRCNDPVLLSLSYETGSINVVATTDFSVAEYAWSDRF
jgi:hypothetical protein